MDVIGKNVLFGCNPFACHICWSAKLHWLCSFILTQQAHDLHWNLLHKRGSFHMILAQPATDWGGLFKAPSRFSVISPKPMHVFSWTHHHETFNTIRSYMCRWSGHTCEQFHFDLACYIISDPEVNDIRFRSTVLTMLSNTVWSLKIRPVVLKIRGGGSK